MKRRTSVSVEASGQTLVEVMLVVVLISILASIAVPKFGGVIRTANEGATRAKLGAIRSALTVYYANSEGAYPSDFSPFLSPGNSFISGVPPAYTYDHGSINTVNLATDINNSDTGAWGFVYTGTSWGTVWVQCTHTDTKGTTWTSY